MIVVVAVGLAIFSFIAGAAKKKGFALAFGLASMLTFIYWLTTGPGFAVIDWLENPQAPEIGEIDMPGVR